MTNGVTKPDKTVTPEPLGDVEKFLRPRERWAAGIVGLVLMAGAGWIAVFPPNRSVPVSGCSAPPSMCTVNVDADLATLAIAIVAAASAAMLVGLFGVRYTSLKAAGVELGISPADATPKIDAVQGPDKPESEDTVQPDDAADGVDEVAESPEIDSVGVPDTPALSPPGFGSMRQSVDAPTVIATGLHDAMPDTPPEVLRAYQAARRESQRGYFLTHVLGPPTTPGQKYSVALKVVAHRSARGDVQIATFFMGRSWGNRVFQGERGVDGCFGVRTEAYGPFLAVCELTFADGDRVLLDHYCDFQMGPLVPR